MGYLVKIISLWGKEGGCEMKYYWMSVTTSRHPSTVDLPSYFGHISGAFFTLEIALSAQFQSNFA
jgi:hypothetical protein